MSPSSSPLTLLIAAREPGQGAALAEMIQSIRPSVRVLHLESALDDERPSLAMVVEPSGPEFGQLSGCVRERFSEVTIVVIAPRFDEGAIDAAAGVGVAAIVPSPCDPATLLRTLEAEERKVGFAGRSSGVETGELLRLHAAAGSDGVLHLRSARGSGAIHLEGGQPIHAHAGGLLGADAVREVLTWADATATWISGRSASARTILGRIQGLLEHDGASVIAAESAVEDAPRDVIEKLDRLSQTPDILAVYLLRNTAIVTGRAEPELDEVLIGRALSRLAQVFHDMEEQQGDGAGSEIQATVGEHRLVVDRLGPSRLGFQIGVVVRQATPVCKSLRRLLRQIDRSFRRSSSQGARAGGGGGGGAGSQGIEAAGLHRVA